MIQLHNSLSGRKEPLSTLTPGEVRMYVCGITVYDFCHVGHARMLVVFDTIRRHLLWRGLKVTFVRNITDIDDKIIDRARANGETMEALTARFINAMDEDCAALGLLRPDHEPRATQYVPQIVAMVEQLIARGHAYVAADGDVMYSVSSFPGYGQLSGKKLEDLRAGSRVDVNEGKRDPLDFVLWKHAKPGEPAWESPWGPGRPGWHIECSAMSTALLGDHFDIHGGGLDLKFPHHENEIAQTCGACGSAFVSQWMHNGFVNVNDEKMSKSLGNFFTVREVLPKLRPEVMRAFVLASHYRGPINYAPENLQQADRALERLYLALRGVEPAASYTPTAATTQFGAAMDDDFNTPEALAALQGLAGELNKARKAKQAEQAAALAAELKTLGSVLGLLQAPAEAWLQSPATLVADVPTPVEVAAAMEARVAARAAKDWAQSDALRNGLAARGVLLEDGAAGSSWRYTIP
ncbi:MAG: cysteinyl-tRNA synthetase [Pseudomonadota bacterium]|jgi:cysteinyl-tRNA synthetase